MSKLIRAILKTNLSQAALDWLDHKCEEIKTLETPTPFYLAFGMVAREIEAKPIEVRALDLEGIKTIHAGFQPAYWKTTELARSFMLVSLPVKKNFLWLKQLFETADLNELASLYKSLPFLPNQGDFIEQAAEGVRTNIETVFDAISLDNPFGAQFFSELAWNQLVLKAIFMSRPVYRIYGLDERRNENLAKTLVDYAHERWSAERTVTPELWRLVIPFLDASIFEDLKRVIDEDILIAKQAAFKVIKESRYEPAKKWATSQSYRYSPISWEEIAQRYHQEIMKI